MATKIKKILVSQPQPTTEKSPYFDIAEKYNVKIVFRQFIKVEPVWLLNSERRRLMCLDIR